jgi:phage I-like protein
MKTAIAALLAASLVTAHAADLPATAADHPWVLLIPAGKFSGRDGRGPYDAGDKVKLEQIAEMTRRYAGNTDILVDYEHQSIHALTNGQPAPAAGWIKEVQARDDGLYGRVEWTANAASAIKGREYRYLSPVYFHTKDGDVLALQTVALTNVPNLDMIEVSAHSVFNFQPPTTEVPMKRVLAALGLADGTGEDDVLTAVNSLLTSSTAIATAAGLSKDAKSEQVMTAVQSAFADRKKIAIAAGQPENAPVDVIVGAFAAAHSASAADPTKYVPIAVFKEMAAKVDSLVTHKVENDAETAVAAAMRAGKITPAQKDWAISLHKANLTMFEEFVGKAPVLTSAQRSTALPPAGSATATAGLDDADLAVMRQMNISVEDMLKSKTSMEAGR